MKPLFIILVIVFYMVLVSKSFISAATIEKALFHHPYKQPTTNLIIAEGVCDNSF